MTTHSSDRRSGFRGLAALSFSLLVLAGCQTVQEVPAETGSVSESSPAVETILEPQPPTALAVEPSQDPVQLTYENPILQLQSNAFSPNSDGYRDLLEFFAAIPVTEGLSRWDLVLFDTSQRTVFSVRGTQTVPGMFQWNGLDPNGRPVPDGVYQGRLTAVYADGTTTSAETARFRLSRTGPRGRIVVPNTYFSPDGDGVNDIIPIRLELEDGDAVTAYKITLFDSMNSIFETYAAPGSPPAVFEWDGKNRRGETVEGADVYRMELELTDELGNIGVLGADIPTDVLVYRDGDRFKIRISSITFLPYSANFADVEPAERTQNLRTLNRLVEILARFPGYQIGIEGHAVQVYWYDQARGRTEQQQVLVPLSVARAEAIRQALVARGVSASRLTASGAGGSAPVVPHSDLQNRWKNRRVEFTLIRQ